MGAGVKKQLGYIRSMSRVNGITDEDPLLISRDDALEYLQTLNCNPYVYYWWSPVRAEQGENLCNPHGEKAAFKRIGEILSIAAELEI